MSRQFYLYLMPEDVESLVHTLRSQLGVSFVRPWSRRPYPVPLESPICTDALMLKKGAVRVSCYITPSKDADIRMRFIRAQSRWNVEIESEAIEFQGCEFDGKVLVRGRFYFQNDILVDGAIVPKRRDFLIWVDKVFRLAKKSLHRSKVLDAYVGEYAEKWRLEGGRFAWTANSQRGPIYETDSNQCT